MLADPNQRGIAQKKAYPAMTPMLDAHCAPVITHKTNETRLLHDPHYSATFFGIRVKSFKSWHG